ncbi:MAG: hypothetical protein J6K80_04150, partial [Oscillospiraceae bacterium]|nr:hypothetical protein [Oscillospiraceae bacterium]
IFSILLFSCFPVYALETYTLECFSETTYIEDDTGERLDFINMYKDRPMLLVITLAAMVIGAAAGATAFYNGWLG